MTKKEYNEMNVGLKKIPKAVALWAIVIIGAFLIFMTAMSIGEDKGQRIERSHQALKITKVIIANTEVIAEHGQLSQQMRENSDIIMRYHHYLDGHDPSVNKVVLCPECWTEEDLSDKIETYFVTEFEAHPEEVPETFEQLLQDCEEIKTGIRAARFSLILQSKTLQRILDKLRIKNGGGK
jgi:hypothetical protein